VDIVRAPLLPRRRGHWLQLTLNYFSFALFASLVGPLRCRGDFDAILVYEPSPVTVGLPALVMKATTGAPVLFWVQDLWPESLSATGAVRSPVLLAATRWLVRRIYARCARILVQSEAFVAPIRALGVPAERLIYYPNSAEDFYQPLPRSQARLPVELPAGFRVMFAGNVGVAQGFETILAAADRLRSHRDIRWLIVGDGRHLEWVRGEIGRRGLADAVHLLGHHPPTTMPAWFAHADAMLVSLRADPIFALTIPAKVQSYMACGRPIVASLDGEGARVVRDSGAGRAAPADDAEALARAVLELYRMPASERERMGARGRAYFEKHFERGALLKRLVSLMEEARKERGACAS
jgi:glycosyltransferase involved in cell wall biosynthesis